jgi:CheY-like chemotaxis protein
MVEENLKGVLVLVVEDEYLIADDLRKALTDAGAEIIGPVPAVGDAIEALRKAERIDAAVLDINLRGEMIFPVADALLERGIPFVFATGYDRSSLPERFADFPRIEKPLHAEKLILILRGLVNRTGNPSEN